MKPYDHFLKTRDLLVQKKLVPHHTLSYFLDPRSVSSAWKEYQDDMIKEYVCPYCQITIKAARTWFRQHLKIHSNKSRYSEKTKKDEAFKTDSKVYFS